jgi:hypothetical protein
MRILEQKDIVQLLRAEVEKAGSQTAWAKKHWIDLAYVNGVLHGARRPSERIIRALGLRTVVLRQKGVRPLWVMRAARPRGCDECNHSETLGFTTASASSPDTA